MSDLFGAILKSESYVSDFNDYTNATKKFEFGELELSKQFRAETEALKQFNLANPDKPFNPHQYPLISDNINVKSKESKIGDRAKTSYFNFKRNSIQDDIQSLQKKAAGGVGDVEGFESALSDKVDQLIKYENKLNQIPNSEAIHEAMNGDTLKGFFNPKLYTDTIVENSLEMGIHTLAVVGSGVAGSFLTPLTGLGTAAGTSSALTFNSKYNEVLASELLTFGFMTDGVSPEDQRKSLMKSLLDPSSQTSLEDMRRKATIQASVAAGIDVATLGVASKIGGSKLVSKGVGKIGAKRTTAAIGVGALGEAAEETLPNLATGDDVNLREALLAALTSGVIETAAEIKAPGYVIDKIKGQENVTPSPLTEGTPFSQEGVAPEVLNDASQTQDISQVAPEAPVVNTELDLVAIETDRLMGVLANPDALQVDKDIALAKLADINNIPQVQDAPSALVTPSTETVDASVDLTPMQDVSRSAGIPANVLSDLDSVNALNPIESVAPQLEPSVAEIDFEYDRAVISEALGENRAKLITFTNQPLVQDAPRVEGTFDTSTGQISINTSAVKPILENGVEVMSRDNRLKWVAWHELMHRGISVKGAGEYKKMLAFAGRNRFINSLSASIATDRGIEQSNVAVEEALAETRAAMELGNFEAITQRYTIPAPRNPSAVRNVINRISDTLRGLVARTTGVETSVSNAQLFKLITKIGEVDTGTVDSDTRGAELRSESNDGFENGPTLLASQAPKTEEEIRNATEPALTSAAAKGLDMSEDARYARAEALGFDTSTVYYHGTKRGGFGAFEKSVSSPGFFFTDDEDVANTYAGDYKELGGVSKKGYVLRALRGYEEDPRISDVGVEPTGDYYAKFAGDYYEGGSLEELADLILADWPESAANPHGGRGIYPVFLKEGIGDIYDAEGRRWDNVTVSQFQVVDDAGVVLKVFDDADAAYNFVYEAEYDNADVELYVEPLQNDAVTLTDEGTTDSLVNKALNSDEDLNHVMIFDVKDDGGEGAETNEPSTLKIMLNPKDIRSIHAAFDPEFENSPTLLASQAPKTPHYDKSPAKLSRRAKWASWKAEFFQKHDIETLVFDHQAELVRIGRKNEQARDVSVGFETYNAKTNSELESEIEPRIVNLTKVIADEYNSKFEGTVNYKGKTGFTEFLRDLDLVGKFVKHGKERNAVIAVKSKGKDLAGSGKSNDEINEITAYANARHPELVSFYESIYKGHLAPTFEYSNKRLRESGLLTPEMEAGQHNWKWYVPLYGAPKIEDPVTGALVDEYSGSNVLAHLKSKEYEAKGRRGTESDSLFQTVFENAESAVRRAQMQPVKQKLLDFVLTGQGRQSFKADVTTIDLATGGAKQLNDLGEFDWVAGDRSVDTGPLENNVLVYRTGNQVHKIKIGNGKAMEAIRNLNPKLNAFARILNVPTRFISSAYTRYNLASFPVVNKLRDSQQMFNYLLSDAPVGVKADSFSGAAKNLFVGEKSAVAMKAAYFNARYTSAWRKDGAHRKEYLELLKEFRTYGGDTTFTKFLTEDKLKQFEREAMINAGFSKGKKTLDTISNFVDAINDHMELTTRISAYQALVEADVPKQDAAVYVKDIMNFEKKGVITRNLNTWFPFFSTATYDINRLRKATSTKEGQILTVLKVAGYMALAKVIAEISGDDEDGVPLYYKHDLSTAGSYIVVPYNSKGESVRIPVGFGMDRITKTTAEASLRWVEGLDTTPQFLENLALNAFGKNLTPISPKEIKDDKIQLAMQTLMYAPALPVVQLGTNTNWKGTFIHTPDRWLSKGELKHESGWQWTPDVYKKLAKTTFEVTGKDVTPEGIKHITESYLGGMARTIAGLAESTVDAIEGNTTTGSSVKKLPLISAFVQHKPLRERKEFNARLDDLKKTKRRYDHAKKNGKDLSNFEDDMFWFKKYEREGKRLKKLNKRLFKARDTLKGAELKAAQERIEKEQDSIRVNLNNEWRLDHGYRG